MSLPGRFLEIGGQRVFYHRTGRGRPLVLLHGFLLSHYSWRHVIPGLAAEHDVIAIDLPGFGESDRPSPADFRYSAAGYMETVVGVLDVLGLERASLLGHSLGAGVALHTAARQPDRVERLIVLDPLVYDFPLPVEGRVLLTPYLGPALMKTVYTRGVLRHYLTRYLYHHPALVAEELVDYLWERLNRPGGFDAAHACLRLCADPSTIGSSLRAVRAPSLIIWGEGDRLFASSHAARLQGELPGSLLHVLPDCGHAPAEERPDEVLRLVLPFLAAGAERRPTIVAVPA